MNSLIAYGSDSEDSDSEKIPVFQTVARKPQPIRPTPSQKTIQIPSHINLEPKEKERELNLPKAISITDEQFMPTFDNEDELDSTVKRKDWEIKLAEKQKKEFKKTKKQIDAFGALSKKAIESVDDNEEIKVPIPKFQSTGNFKSSFLSSLPPPKSNSNVVGKPKTSSLAFTPSSVSKEFLKSSAPKKPRIDDDAPAPSTSNDFFGLDSVLKKDLIDVKNLPRSTAHTNMFVVDEEIGPAKPVLVTETDQYNEQTTNIKKITDDEAKKIIYEREIEPWGASNVYANEAVRNIVEVNVDEQLGPNIRETLLKNLDYSSVASFGVGRQAKQASKTPQEKLAKSKHQITHLANLALAREDQLKEQWAQNKAAKTASKRKYGF